jgi:hypothetical protein
VFRIKAVLSRTAANEYAERGVLQECGYEHNESHFVNGDVSVEETVASVRAEILKSKPPCTTKSAPREIEVKSRDLRRL